MANILTIEKGHSNLVGVDFFALLQNGTPIAFSLFEAHIKHIKEAIENGTLPS